MISKLILGLASAFVFAVPALAGEDALSPMIINIADRACTSLDISGRGMVMTCAITFTE